MPTAAQWQAGTGTAWQQGIGTGLTMIARGALAAESAWQKSCLLLRSRGVL